MFFNQNISVRYNILFFSFIVCFKMGSMFLQGLKGTWSVETSSKAIYKVWDLPPPFANKNLGVMPCGIERGPICSIMRKH